MEKIYTLIAGVNGAGKSTFYRLGSILPEKQERVNPDEILKANKGDWRNINDQMDAMKEAVRRIRTYLESVDIAIERVAGRVKNGGHGIKEEDIRKRYESSLKNFKSVIELCDKVYVYDNTEKFKEIAIFDNGKILDGSLKKCGWFDRIYGENPEQGCFAGTDK